MNSHKITMESLNSGSLRTTLDHHMHRAELSDQGRERVNTAVQAAIEHISKQHDLRYGVGGHHLDEAAHFLENKYAARHDLKPKERDVLHAALEQHFGIEKVEEKEAA